MQPTRATRWFPAFLCIVIASMIVAIVVSAIVQSKLLNRDLEPRQVIAHTAHKASVATDARRSDAASDPIRIDVVAVRPHGWVQALQLWLLSPGQDG